MEDSQPSWRVSQKTKQFSRKGKPWLETNLSSRGFPNPFEGEARRLVCFRGTLFANHIHLPSWVSNSGGAVEGSYRTCIRPNTWIVELSTQPPHMWFNHISFCEHQHYDVYMKQVIHANWQHVHACHCYLNCCKSVWKVNSYLDKSKCSRFLSTMSDIDRVKCHVLSFDTIILNVMVSYATFMIWI